MNRNNRTSLAHLWLDALLILGLLALVAAGAGLYRSGVDAQRLHAQQRSALAYVQSQAAACRVGVEDEADVLLLSQPGEAYVTRIYLYEKTLRSQLVPIGAVAAPEDGDVICPLETFRLSVNGSLLKVDTDMGSAYIHCFGGGAHG